MKIGIFGGSFNPIHKGHIEVAKYATKHLKLDKLIFVPVFKSVSKKTMPYAPASCRVEMIKLVMPKDSKISLFEIKKGGLSYTIDTIRYFKNKYKNDQLFFIIGSDNVAKLHKWKGIKEIANKSQIVIFKREETINKKNVKRFNAIVINNPLWNFSSTRFRKGYLENVDKKVIKYISNHYLYIREIAKSMLSYYRFNHCVAVANFAVELTKKNKVSSKKAWVAGMLHDITKDWSLKKHYNLLKKYQINTKVETHNLHSLTGMIWTKEEYLLNDKEILDAILKHTSLGVRMSTMDKIIFAADKLAIGRKYAGIQSDRQRILNNFDEGFKIVVRKNYQKLKELKRNISNEQKKIFEKWMN